jgi:hypothetical protein
MGQREILIFYLKKIIEIGLTHKMIEFNLEPIKDCCTGFDHKLVKELGLVLNL